MGGGHTASADTKGGSSSCRCGGDLRGVADGAVTPGSPDADIVVLAGQVVLAGRHGGGAGVPVETGDGSWRNNSFQDKGNLTTGSPVVVV